MPFPHLSDPPWIWVVSAASPRTSQASPDHQSPVDIESGTSTKSGHTFLYFNYLHSSCPWFFFLIWCFKSQSDVKMQNPRTSPLFTIVYVKHCLAHSEISINRHWVNGWSWLAPCGTTLTWWGPHSQSAWEPLSHLQGQVKTFSLSTFLFNVILL